MEIDLADILLNVLLAIAIFVILWSLWRAHKANSSLEKFNLIDLFRNREGYIDRPALMEMIVFILFCWAFVVQVSQKHLQEWFAIAFLGAFVLRAGHAAWLKKEEANGVSGPVERKTHGTDTTPTAHN